MSYSRGFWGPLGVDSSGGLKSKGGVLGCLEVVARIAWEVLDTTVLGAKLGKWEMIG